MNGPQPGLPSQAERHAFTLLELLMVMALIVLLASLLIPALGRAKAFSRSTVCANHLRQHGLACFMYASDAGRFPMFTEWLYAKTHLGDLTSGQLYPYLKSKAVYLCPTDKAELDRIQLPAKAPARQNSYLLNCNMCHARDIAGCLSPSQTAFFLEGTHWAVTMGPTNNVVPSLIVGMATPVRWGAIGPASFIFRHNGRSNLLMTDMHVQRMSQTQFGNAQLNESFWFPNDQRGGSAGF